MRASVSSPPAARSRCSAAGATSLPQDVYDVAYDVLNHRLVLSFDAVADGVTVDDVLVETLTKVGAPRVQPSGSMSRCVPLGCPRSRG